ncbi:MAG: hypothetical protein LBM93_15770, partial [Oscillospiraceae bacterium]|nr:hypothetical protein [Oscillospiraceae bacterium]
ISKFPTTCGSWQFSGFGLTVYKKAPSLGAFLSLLCWIFVIVNSEDSYSNAYELQRVKRSRELRELRNSKKSRKINPL